MHVAGCEYLERTEAVPLTVTRRRERNERGMTVSSGIGRVVFGTMLLVILGIAPGCTGLPEVEQEDPILAIVGDDVILSSELRREILERYYGRTALLGMVRRSLFEQEASRLGLQITDSMLEAEVDKELARMLGGEEDREKQIAALARRGVNLDEVRRNLRYDAANWLLMSSVAKARRTDDARVRQLYDQTFRHDRRRVGHIAFPFGVDQLDEKIVNATHQRAEAVYQRLRQGADFGEVAREVSGNSDTARRGGEIGWMHRGSLPAERQQMTDAIFRIGVGEFTRPVREDEYGWHIFVVWEEAPQQAFESVQDELRQELSLAEPTLEELAALEEVLRQQTDVVVHDSALSGDGG